VKPKRESGSWDAILSSQLGYAYAVNGNTAGTHQILDEVLEQLKHGSFSAKAIAEVYIGLQDKDGAFEWLRKAVDEKEVNMYLKTEPVYESLRSDPRFADLLRSANTTLPSRA
jgi:Tfp pilus assembly protein PilF